MKADLVTNIDFRSSADTTLVGTTRTFEAARDLLDDVQNIWRPGANAQLISRYDYASDGLARRSSVVNSGAAFGGTGNERLSLWQYNPRNELTLSDRHQGSNPAAPGAAVSAEHFSYAYDAILDTVARLQRQVGSRTTYTPGTLAPPAYGRNELNQYFTPARTVGLRKHAAAVLSDKMIGIHGISRSERRARGRNARFRLRSGWQFLYDGR